MCTVYYYAVDLIIIRILIIHFSFIDLDTITESDTLTTTVAVTTDSDTVTTDSDTVTTDSDTDTVITGGPKVPGGKGVNLN